MQVHVGLPMAFQNANLLFIEAKSVAKKESALGLGFILNPETILWKHLQLLSGDAQFADELDLHCCFVLS